MDIKLNFPQSFAFFITILSFPVFGFTWLKFVNVTNLLLYLGGTLGNQTDTGRIYANLRDSMGLDDFLIVSEGISNSFAKKNITQAHQYHIQRTTWILDLLGLKDVYSKAIFNVFNAAKRETNRKVGILKDVIIKLKIDSKHVQINLESGREILVLKFFWHKETEIIQQVVDHGFAIDQFCTNRDASCALMMVRPKQLR